VACVGAQEHGLTCATLGIESSTVVALI